MEYEQQAKEQRVRVAAHARIQRGLELIDQGLHMLRILDAPDPKGVKTADPGGGQPSS